MYGNYTSSWLLIRILLIQSHSVLPHPPTPVYSFILTPGLCRSDMGVVLALGAGLGYLLYV